MRKIEIIRSHVGRHADELWAEYFLRRFGKDVDIDASEASFEEWKSEEIEDRPDVVYIGIGGPYLQAMQKQGRKVKALIFDEHRTGYPKGRLPHDCAATLVGKFVNQFDNHRRLFGEINHCDANAGIRETRISSIVKTLNHHLPAKEVQKWFTFAADALVARVNHGPCDLEEMWETYQLEHMDMSPDVSKRITTLIGLTKYAATVTWIPDGETEPEPIRNPTELSIMIEYIPVELRREWLFWLFDIWALDVALFQEAMSHVRGLTPVEILTDMGSECMLVIDDQKGNPHFHRVAQSHEGGKANVVVIRKQSGTMMIVSNPKRPLLVLQLTAAMLRAAEIRVRTGRIINPTDLIGDGALEECPCWYKHTGHMIFNGSDTHPDVEPTRLTLKQVQEIVITSLTLSLVDAWTLRFMNGLWPNKTLTMPGSTVAACNQAYHLVK